MTIHINNPNFDKIKYDKFDLIGKRKNNCALCGLPLWAHVDNKTDEFYLSCGCGDTTVRQGYSKVKHCFVYADEACGVE